jgi:condensation domain-containing protein
MSSESGGKRAVSTRPRIYPMSYEQESLWLGDFVWDGPSRYLESWACRFTGQLDHGAVEWALSQVIARHEVLRSRLTEQDGELVQIVTDPGPVQLAQVSCPPAALPAELSRITAQPLDLNEAPIRPWLVCLSPDEFVLVVQCHHAVVDDWALDIFQRELMHFYTARLLGQPATLEPLRMQVGEFAVAQRAARVNEADLAYWRERADDAPRSCPIPLDMPRPEELPHRAERHLFDISPERGRAVRALARALRTTPYTVFAAAVAALLWQYGEPEEVVFGTPVSVRGTATVDNMIGCLSNVLPLRMAVSRDASFRTVTEAAQAEILGAMEHRAVPYSAIVRMTRRWTLADMPAQYSAVLVVDDMRWDPFSLPGITAERIYIPPGRAKFDMSLTLVADDDGGYEGFCDYDADIYHAATMSLAASRFTNLLARCTAAPEDPLALVAGSASELSGE